MTATQTEKKQEIDINATGTTSPSTVDHLMAESAYTRNWYSLSHIIWIFMVILTCYDFFTDITFASFLSSFTYCPKFKTCIPKNERFRADMETIKTNAITLMITSSIGFIAAMFYKCYELYIYIKIYKSSTSLEAVQNEMYELFSKQVQFIWIPLVIEDIVSIYLTGISLILLYAHVTPGDPDQTVEKPLIIQTLVLSSLSVILGITNILRNGIVKKYFCKNACWKVSVCCFFWILVTLIACYSIFLTTSNLMTKGAADTAPQQVLYHDSTEGGCTPDDCTWGCNEHDGDIRCMTKIEIWSSVSWFGDCSIDNGPDPYFVHYLDTNDVVPMEVINGYNLSFDEMEIPSEEKEVTAITIDELFVNRGPLQTQCLLKEKRYAVYCETDGIYVNDMEAYLKCTLVFAIFWDDFNLEWWYNKSEKDIDTDSDLDLWENNDWCVFGKLVDFNISFPVCEPIVVPYEFNNGYEASIDICWDLCYGLG